MGALTDVLGPDEGVVEEAGLFLGEHQNSSCSIGKSFVHTTRLGSWMARVRGHVPARAKPSAPIVVLQLSGRASPSRRSGRPLDTAVSAHMGAVHRSTPSSRHRRSQDGSPRSCSEIDPAVVSVDFDCAQERRGSLGSGALSREVPSARRETIGPPAVRPPSTRVDSCPRRSRRRLILIHWSLLAVEVRPG